MVMLSCVNQALKGSNRLERVGSGLSHRKGDPKCPFPTLADLVGLCPLPDNPNNLCPTLDDPDSLCPLPDDPARLSPRKGNPVSLCPLPDDPNNQCRLKDTYSHQRPKSCNAITTK